MLIWQIVMCSNFRFCRYLACIMDVATPTEDCLNLIFELLSPVMKCRDENALSRQEVMSLPAPAVNKLFLLLVELKIWKRIRS